jgi:hypothetical protein
VRLLALLCLVALVASCNATYTVELNMPYCPVSDSAKAAADSVPIACVLPDSLRR